MAITLVTSLESQTVANTLAATTPGSVSVGNTLIAQCGVNNLTATVTPPAGWTTVNSQTSPGGGTLGANVWIFYKIADSSDAAASTFTFGSSVSQALRVFIMNYSGIDQVTPLDSTNKDLNTNVNSPGSKTFSNSVTPTNPDSLLMASFVGDDVNLTVSSISIANDNPTWTKIYNDTITQIWTAIRPQTTATGTMTTSSWSTPINGEAILSVFNADTTIPATSNFLQMF